MAAPALLQAALDKGGYSASTFAYLLGSVEHESRFGGPRSDHSYSVSMYEDWDPQNPTALQKAYEGKRSLGNDQPGDGYRFRGRGYIQLTGRDMYKRLGKAVGYPDIPGGGLDSQTQSSKIPIWLLILRLQQK